MLCDKNRTWNKRILQKFSLVFAGLSVSLSLSVGWWIVIWLSPSIHFCLFISTVIVACDKCKVCGDPSDHEDSKNTKNCCIHLFLLIILCCRPNIRKPKTLARFNNDTDTQTTGILYAVDGKYDKNDAMLENGCGYNVKLKMRYILPFRGDRLGSSFFWFVCAFFPEPSRLYHRNAIYKNCNKWRQGIRRIRFRIIVLSLFIIIGVIGCRHRRHCGRVFFHFSLPSSIGFRVRFLVLIVSTHSVFCVFVCILLSSSFCFVYKIFSLRSIYVSGVFLAE